MKRMDYWLIGLDGPARKVRLPIKGAILIGRGTYNHVVLKDHRISRQHARIAFETDGLVIYDLGSTNGTFVNGAQTSRSNLKLNDEVRFGTLVFKIGTGSQGLETSSDKDVPDLEVPTLRDMGSISKVLAAGSRDRDSSMQLPVVDLGQLEDAYEKLGTLYSFMQAISQTIEKTKLLQTIAGKTREIYQNANRVSIYMLSPSGGTFELAHASGDESAPAPPPTLPLALGMSFLETQAPVLEPPPPNRTSGGAGMYAPLTDLSDTLGVIHVAAGPRTQGFTRADLDLLAGMAAPAAMMLRNAKHHAEILQQDRLNYDLHLAEQIQKSFLPREVVSVEGIDLVAEYQAAYSVGGDFYDVFWVAPDRLGIFIGDIAGKGVAGALLMARMSSEMHVAALTNIDPVMVLTAMNKALIARGQPEVFFTAIYMTLDVRSGEVVLANAGHPLPYCARANGVLEQITEGGAPIGIVDEPNFEATHLHLGNGDSLVLYTDGVIEAANREGKLYGEDRLEQALHGSGRAPQEISDTILASVRAYAGSTPLADDLTLLICQRNVGRPPSLQPRRMSRKLMKA